jgi:hypothetical protein
MPEEGHGRIPGPQPVSAIMQFRLSIRTLSMRATKLIILLALAFTVSACSMFRHKGDTIDNMPVDKLYSNAHNSM